MKKIYIFVLIILMVVSNVFSSCSHNVKFSDGFEECVYKDNVYVDFKNRDGATCWVPLPSPEQIKKVDLKQGKAYKIDVVFSTLENPANFIIISYKAYQVEIIEQRPSHPYIREDIELTSVFDTPFGSVVAEYRDSVSKDEMYFNNIPSGTTFTDLIGENNEGTREVPYGLKGYCDLYCSYPGMDYLKCIFSIVVAEGKYYLIVRTESEKRGLDDTFYILDHQKFSTIGE